MTTPTATLPNWSRCVIASANFGLGNRGRIGFVLAALITRRLYGDRNVNSDRDGEPPRPRRSSLDGRRGAAKCPDGVGAEYNTPTTIRVPQRRLWPYAGRSQWHRSRGDHAIYDYFRIRATALEECAQALTSLVRCTHGWKVVIIPPSARRDFPHRLGNLG